MTGMRTWRGLIVALAAAALLWTISAIPAAGPTTATAPSTSPTTKWAGPSTVPAPAPAKGNQFSIAIIPDPQSYTGNYDVARGGEKWVAKGFPYKERFDQQVQWVVASRDTYNIRFSVDLGDNVQHFGYNPAKSTDPASAESKVHGEWLNAAKALSFFHKDADPTKPALVPYAIVIGNHDYHLPRQSDLDSTEYEHFFGPGRWRDEKGEIRAAFADWHKGDDKGWEYRVKDELLATGVGRNSYQVFAGGGRAYLHLTLECAPTDQAIAWAQSILKQHPGQPTIVSTHSFISGGGQLLTADKMGRVVKDGKNPTNAAQALFDKLIKDNDQIFMLLCGHSFGQQRVVMKNARGHEVQIIESCYHVGYGGGRIRLAEKPASGWAYQGTTDDLERNGCGWMRLMLFDPDRNRIVLHTYSPVLGLWAGNRAPDSHAQPDGHGVWWNRTYPVGEGVTEEFAVDFIARFGPVPPAAPATTRRAYP